MDDKELIIDRLNDLAKKLKVEVCYLTSGFYEHGEISNKKAMYIPWDNKIVFNKGINDSNELFCYIYAHELAHAYRHADSSKQLAYSGHNVLYKTEREADNFALVILMKEYISIFNQLDIQFFMKFFQIPNHLLNTVIKIYQKYFEQQLNLFD